MGTSEQGIARGIDQHVAAGSCQPGLSRSVVAWQALRQRRSDGATQGRHAVGAIRCCRPSCRQPQIWITLGLTFETTAALLGVQLGASATLEHTARLFVELIERGLLRERQGLWQLAWMPDGQFLEVVEAAGIPAPCCSICGVSC